MDAIMLIEKDKANSFKKGDNIWSGCSNGKHSNRIKSISVSFAGVYRCGGRNYWYDTE